MKRKRIRMIAIVTVLVSALGGSAMNRLAKPNAKIGRARTIYFIRVM